MNGLGLRLLAIVALVAANAFFVAAEFALVASRRTRIEAMIRRGDRKARTVRKALSDLYRLLSATQLGITLTTRSPICFATGSRACRAASTS